MEGIGKEQVWTILGNFFKDSDVSKKKVKFWFAVLLKGSLLVVGLLGAFVNLRSSMV